MTLTRQSEIGRTGSQSLCSYCGRVIEMDEKRVVISERDASYATAHAVFRLCAEDWAWVLPALEEMAEDLVGT